MTRLLLPLALLAAPLRADEPARGPWLVDASSYSARACWREAAGPDRCKTLSVSAPGDFTYSVDGSTRSYSSKTLPPAGAVLRFAAFGDSGKAGDHQAAVAGQVAAWKPDLVVHVGDVVYPRGADADYDAKYFRPYAAILPSVPVFPCPGNHDYGNRRLLGRNKGSRSFMDGYYRAFRRGPYYSFDAGDVHFVSLDDNFEGYGVDAAAPLAGAQLAWLEGDLARSSARWKIVFLHVPLYSSLRHGDNEAVRKLLEPVLRRFKVDLVLQGHDHMYERSRPIGGIVYVTAGGGGASRAKRPSRRYEGSEVVIRDYGFAAVTVERDRLALEMVGEDGRVRDRYELKKSPQ